MNIDFSKINSTNTKNNYNYFYNGKKYNIEEKFLPLLEYNDYNNINLEELEKILIEIKKHKNYELALIETSWFKKEYSPIEKVNLIKIFLNKYKDLPINTEYIRKTKNELKHLLECLDWLDERN